jgi:hypothetical protein
MDLKGIFLNWSEGDLVEIQNSKEDKIRGWAMKWKKIALSAGLAFLSTLLLIGGFPESNAQSIQTLDLSKPRLRDRIQSSGYITSKPISPWGTIIAGKETVVALTEGEVVYIRLEPGKEVQVGDRFSIVRLGRSVTHPVTKHKIGNLVLMPGELTIIERKDNMATAKINKSFSAIYHEDMIIPAKPVLPETVPIRTEKRIEGFVVFSPEDAVNISEKEFVFIDRGSQDGVMMGDLFSIYQHPPRLYGESQKEAKGLPMIKVGEAVVVSVQEENSTALVTHSFQPIHVGDKVVSGKE